MLKMPAKTWTVLLALITQGIFAVYASGTPEFNPVVTIQHSDISNQKIVSLHGPWQFYPGKFIAPGSFESEKSLPWISKISARQWVDPAVRALPAQGFGTYRLSLKIPAGIDNLALLPGTIGSSATIWWNGVLVARYGKVAENQGSTSPWAENSVHPLPKLAEGQSNVELVIQVANFDDLTPGFQEIPLLGSIQALSLHKFRVLSLFCALAGFCFAMGIYHLFRFAFRHQDLANLFFAGICWALALRILTGDTLPIVTLLPSIPWQTTLDLNYLSLTLLLVFFPAFIASLFRYRFGVILAIFSLVVSAGYTLLIFWSPTTVYIPWLSYYLYFAIVIGLGALIQLISALIQRKSGALLFAVGFLVVFSTAIYDICMVLNRFASPSLVMYGGVAFMIVQAIIMSRNSARLAKTSERLSLNLKTINASQARFLPQQLLDQLGKNLVTELSPGEHIRGPFTIMVIDYGLSMNAHTDPDQITETLNGIHSAIGPIIRDHNGFITYYGAHGVHVVFPSSCTHALKTAIQLCNSGSAGQLRQGLPLRIRVAIHYGDLLLGLLGEADRMNGDIISCHLADTEKLLERAQLLDIQIMLSSDAMKHLSPDHQWQFRLVGIVKLAIGPQAVYDFFDVDPPALWRAKRASRRMLSKALHAQSARHNIDAITLYRTILKDFPNDAVARYHLEKLGVDPYQSVAP